MKNALDNKARFLSIYLNCEFENRNVYGHIHKYSPDGMVKTFLYHGAKPYSLETSYVLLKPVSSISDEDCHAIWHGRTREELVMYLTGGTEFNEMCGSALIKALEPKDYDYLRIKGYALPWMGLGVEQLIEYGWVKLEENK